MGSRKPNSIRIKGEVIIGRVYRIFNDIDNKVYIGSTIKPLAKRLGDHMYSYNINTNMDLYHHMRLIGKQYFTMELLECKQVNKLSELYMLEQIWINKENPENLLNNKKAYKDKELKTTIEELIEKVSYIKLNIINDKA